MDSSRTMKRKGLTRAGRFALAALSGSLLLTACTSVHTTSEGAIGLKRRQINFSNGAISTAKMSATLFCKTAGSDNSRIREING